MTFPTHKVAIVGCGTAGASAALFLNKLGHDVTVFERVPEPGPAGAGILMQPTGLSVLEKLGLRDTIEAHGARIERIRGVTPHNRLVLNVSYTDYDSRYYGMGLHRGVLFTHLFEAVQKAGIPVLCGVEITRFIRVAKGQSLLTTADKALYGPFSLIIVADGARSQLRQATDLTRRVTRYPWGALWHIGPDPTLRFQGELFQIYAGVKQMIGFLPTGRGVADDTPLVSLFWSIKLTEVDQWRTTDLAEWKADVLAIAPQAERYLANVTDHEQLPVAVYYDVQLSQWHTDHIVFIGDAAHAMSPQLGQGANLALFDAQVLYQCLRDEPNLAEALQNYSNNRRQHLGYYQFVSRWLTPLFQSSFTPLAWPRDWVFEPIARQSFFKTQMVESLMGIKTGLFSTLPF